MKRFKTLISYTLYTLLVAFLFCGCEAHERELRKKQVQNLQIVEFDNCEYLVGYRQLTHKGNCKFCAERSKK